MKKHCSHAKPAEQKNTSIITGFSVYLAIDITALFIILGILSYSTVKKGSVQSFSSTMSGILPVYANTVDSLNQQFINEMNPYTKSYFVAVGDTEGIVNWIRQNSARRSADFESIFFCGLDKIAHTDDGKDIDISDRAYFNEIMQEKTDFYISNQMLSKADNTPVYQVCVAAYNTGRKKIGFFAGSVTLAKLQEYTENIKVGTNGYLAVFDGNGICIAHRDKTKVLTNMNNSTDQKKLAVIKRMIHRESGAGQLSDGSYAFFEPIKDTLWSIAAVLPAAEVNATANSLGKTLVVLFLLFIIILIVIAAGLTAQSIMKSASL